MDRPRRVEVKITIGEGKEACQRALVADRQAIIERTEIFVYQLQCDLSLLDTPLANVDAILAGGTQTPCLHSRMCAISNVLPSAGASGQREAPEPHRRSRIFDR